MLKKIFALVIIVSANHSFAQIALAVDSMEINTLKVKVFSDGGLQEIQTEFQGNYNDLLYVQNLWFGGIDSANQLKVSGQTFRQSRVNFYPGPVSNDPNAQQKYNKVYKVSLQTITDFVNGNTAGIPQEITDWPAHGDVSFGEAADLAPFVDVNNDGNYVPADGDYPDIKGDEAIYAIYNDNLSFTQPPENI